MARTKKRRVPLGHPLPPVKEIGAPTEQELDQANALWDMLVPEWAGLLDAKPMDWEGKPEPKFRYDEIKKQVIRVSDGHVVTLAEKRAAMDKATKAVRR